MILTVRPHASLLRGCPGIWACLAARLPPPNPSSVVAAPSHQKVASDFAEHPLRGKLLPWRTTGLKVPRAHRSDTSLQKCVTEASSFFVRKVLVTALHYLDAPSETEQKGTFLKMDLK